VNPIPDILPQKLKEAALKSFPERDMAVISYTAGNFIIS